MKKIVFALGLLAFVAAHVFLPFLAARPVGAQGVPTNTVAIVSTPDPGSASIPVVCGSAVSSCVLKASPGNLYSVYAECSAACWLMVFNAVAAPVNGSTTAGVASGNLVDCVAIAVGTNGGISHSGLPASFYSVGITAVISSTTCATLTLATTGFINGKVR